MTQRISISVWYLTFVAVLTLLLSGCMLASGEQSSADPQTMAGNVSTSFVSAEGIEERTLATGRAGTLDVIAIVAVDQGDLRVDVLNGQGAVAFSLAGRPNTQVTRTGRVATDAQGQLHYRVVTRDARNGSFQILYQRQES